MMMILGFTGARHPPTEAQQQFITRNVQDSTELHHGACVGSDAFAHKAAVEARVLVVVHPPTDRKLAMTMAQLISLHGGVSILADQPYHDRNRDIVDACDVLIATPDGPWRPHSGTWYTVNYAHQRHIPVVVCYPDGTIE